MILCNSILSIAFAGIRSADSSSLKPVCTEMATNVLASEQLVWFEIVKSSSRNSKDGTGCFSAQQCPKMQVFVWDCLDRPVSLYTAFCNRTNQLYGKTGYRQTALKLRNASSNKCSLYCFFLIHYMAKTPCELSQIDEKLKLCREIERIRFINDKYNTLFRYTLL